MRRLLYKVRDAVIDPQPKAADNGKNWMQTASGGCIDLPVPRPGQIKINDLAHHLSRINRFAGAIKMPYFSVAEHCLNASLIAQELKYSWYTQMYCLLHDGHEMVTGDIIAPVKWVMPSGDVSALERTIDRAIITELAPQLFLSGTANLSPRVLNETYHIDMWLRWREAEFVLDGGTVTWNDTPPQGLPINLTDVVPRLGIHPDSAKEQFLRRYSLLMYRYDLGREKGTIKAAE